MAAEVNARVRVEDEEFGEDFYVKVDVSELIRALKTQLPGQYRSVAGDRRITLPREGLWLCFRIGDET